MKFTQKLKWLACSFILCSGFGGTASVFAQDFPLYEENTLYVKYKDHSEFSAKAMLNGKSGNKNIQTSLLINADLINRFKIEPKAFSMALFDNPVLDKTFMITIEPETPYDIELLKEELEQNPDVDYVERVPFNHILSTDGNRPNDPYYGIVGTDKKINVSWHLDMINAEKAWEIQKGTPNTIVAVVDNAVWGDHADLQIPSSRQYNCNSDDEGNSNPPTQAMNRQNQQCDSSAMINSNCLAYDFSHGTHCAGAIAAINNNGIGIASIGGGVSLLAIGGPSMQWPTGIMHGYRGINWALSKGAKVISCSWGSEGFSATDEAVVKACYEHGVIVIAASGNNNTSVKHYPAAYAPYVISIGSVDADRKKSSFSNHGNWVDVLSPGGVDTAAYKAMIFSTTFCQNQNSRLFGGVDYFNGQYYDEMQGTSMATPVLAGVVALMVSKDPTLTTDQVRTILQNTGQPIHYSHRSYYNDYCNIVDAYKALNFLGEKEYMPAVDTLTAEAFTTSVGLIWTAPKTTETIKGYNIYRNGTLIAENHNSRTYHDPNLENGAAYRYAVEPVYENANYYSTRTETDIDIKKIYKISATIRPSNHYGSVEGVGSYTVGEKCTLKAVPNPDCSDCQFENWFDEAGVMFTNNPLSIPVLENKSFFAFFTGNPPDASNEDLQLVKKAVRISPNPAKDEINIQCADYELQHIRISDTRGRELYISNLNGQHSIDLHIGSLAKGTYVVQVTTSKGTVSQKLIKQ